jgi:hypothetical protein
VAAAVCHYSIFFLLSVMRSDQDNFIAGWKTSTDWQVLRARLLANALGAWQEAFADFFQTRLTLRYLHPIKVLQDNGTFRGEGFSIVAIQCSLIEFLESTAQGTTYRYLRRGEALAPHEYSSSRDVFVAFLKDRMPFSATFDETSAQDFYVGVRCGLLHEARTRNGWRIWAKGPAQTVANVSERIVYRDNFQQALLEYIQDYGEKLQHDERLQQAFVYKFDSLCT